MRRFRCSNGRSTQNTLGVITEGHAEQTKTITKAFLLALLPGVEGTNQGNDGFLDGRNRLLWCHMAPFLAITIDHTLYYAQGLCFFADPERLNQLLRGEDVERFPAWPLLPLAPGRPGVLVEFNVLHLIVPFSRVEERLR